MRKFDWFLVALILAACATYPKAPRPESEVAPTLLNQFGSAVVKLTPPGNPRTGGTGFYMQAPSGEVVTVTNGHVCEVSPDGHWLEATDDSGVGRELLEIREISTTTDLCILSGPSSPPANLPKLATYQSRMKRVWSLGHPFLKPNTLTSGYIVGFEEVTLDESELKETQCKPPTRMMEDNECVRKLWAFETSVVIYPGNSGSPVLTDEGEVVGVFFAGDGRSNRGIFIPLSDLKALVSKY